MNNRSHRDSTIPHKSDLLIRISNFYEDESSVKFLRTWLFVILFLAAAMKMLQKASQLLLGHITKIAVAAI